MPRHAFSQNKTLTSIKLPKTLKEIGSYAFWRCKLTGNLIIPTGVTTIEMCAFAECNKLTGNLIIPEGVISVGELAFSNTYYVDGGSLTIPASIKIIGNSAFPSDLSPVYCKAVTPPDIDSGSFSNYSKLYVPLNCAEIYRNASGWNKFESIEEVEF